MSAGIAKAEPNDGVLKMAAREQFAWVWLSALLVTYVPYFVAVASLQPQAGAPYVNLTEFALLGAAAAAQMLILGVGQLVVRSRREAGARTKPDERDRAIEHRAATVAYYVLIVGMIVVGCVMPFSASGWEIVHAAVLAIAIAEIAHYGLVVRAYRSGWRA